MCTGRLDMFLSSHQFEDQRPTSKTAADICPPPGAHSISVEKCAHREHKEEEQSRECSKQCDLTICLDEHAAAHTSFRP